MDRSQEIVNQLKPSHIQDEIPGNTEDLKAEIKSSTSLPPSEKDPSEELKCHKEYPFDFSWTSPNGKAWKGKFVNKILTIADRQNAGVTMARLGGGMPTESLDVLTEEINVIIAHMMFSLVKTPEWAKNLRELHEVSLIQAIYKEVASHEATFFGPRADKEDSEG